MKQTVESGPINVKLAKSIALQKANADGSQGTVSAQSADIARRALSEANLWLDTACTFDPTSGEAQMLTRAGWVEDTLESWRNRRAGRAVDERRARLGDLRASRQLVQRRDRGMFAGPVPIPVPDGMKDPGQLIKLLGNTSFAMQLGHAAGDLSHEVNGSFDQGIALLKNPAGGLIMQNIEEYATSLDILSRR